MRIDDLLWGKKSSFCFVDDAGKYDKRYIQEQSERLCSKLLECKVVELDRVGLVSENSISFLVGLFAILRVGAIAVIVDPIYPYEMIQDFLIHVGAKNVCVSGNIPIKTFAENKDKWDLVGNVLIDKWGDWNVGKESRTYLSEKFAECTPALILPTSGTTGKIKAVLLNHEAILKNVIAIVDYMNPCAKDTFYIAKSMTHSSTLVGEIFVALYVGAKVIALNPRRTVSSMLRAIEEHSTTILCVNPSILRLICSIHDNSRDFYTLQKVYTSGAITSCDLLEKAKEIFRQSRVLNVYGLTEAGPRVTAQREMNCNGSVGKPISGVEVYIGSHNGKYFNFKNLVGKIYVKTDSLMCGYYNDFESTSNKIKNGIIDTGDIGYINSDGELFVIGRADEMIISSAHNVYPDAIENVIYMYNSKLENIVFGIEDKLYGQKIVCFFSDEKVNLKKLLEYMRKQLPPYEIPHEFYFGQTIPKTASGKKSRLMAQVNYKSNEMKT